MNVNKNLRLDSIYLNDIICFDKKFKKFAYFIYFTFLPFILVNKIYLVF